MSASVSTRIRSLEHLLLAGWDRPTENLSLETLLDVYITLYDEVSKSSLKRQKQFSNFVDYAAPYIERVKQLRMQKTDFDILKVIGRGAFGEVALCKLKTTKKVYAMKILHKWEMIRRADTACFREERDVMVHGNREWITELYYAFQDEKSLYLVMNYYVGGDLLTLLVRNGDHFSESMTRFYAAEMIVALDSLHKLGYVHRDLKPDNVLIDASGHIRLADFGSCLKMDSQGFVVSKVAVGTPDYISPEILQAMEDGKGKYGRECDWWSLGICIFEMLFGETPFYAEGLVETYAKIMNHKTNFYWPTKEHDENNPIPSEELKSLISGLVCDREVRLGQKGIDEFKQHPFFKQIDWTNIKKETPPFVPDFSSQIDTSNFDIDDERLQGSNTEQPVATGSVPFTGNHLPFIGFTFTSDSKISDTGKILDSDSLAKETEIKTLKDELEKALQKSVEADKNQKPMKESLVIHELTTKVELKQKQITSLSNQRDENIQEIQKLSDSLKHFTRDTNNLKAALQSADEQISSYKAKIAALKSENDQLETDLAEKINETADYKSQYENSKTKLAEQTDVTNTLQQELEKLRLAPVEANEKSEQLELRLQRLQSEQKQYFLENQAIRDSIAEKELKESAYEHKIMALTDKLENAKIQAQRDANEQIREIQGKFDREKQALDYENSQLIKEHKQQNEKLAMVETQKRSLQTQLDEQLLQNDESRKLAVNWETQIRSLHSELDDPASIIADINSKLKAHVESLIQAKQNNQNPESLKLSLVNEKNSILETSDWQTVRRNKQRKQEMLDLQAKLESEIISKQEANEELASMSNRYSRLESKMVEMDQTLREKDALVLRLQEEIQAINERNQQKGSFHDNYAANGQLEQPHCVSEHAAQWVATHCSQEHEKSNSEAKSEESSSKRVHKFIVKTFSTSKRCGHCSSIMLGVKRQGTICENCKFNCHIFCAKDALNVCPISFLSQKFYI